MYNHMTKAKAEQLMEQILDRDIKDKNWIYKFGASRFRREVKAVKLKSIVKTHSSTQV